MNRLAAGLAGVTLAVMAAVLVPSASAAGASITQVGWWTQRPGAAALPKGGFELALAPNGPVSQAALRIQVDAVQLTSAQLELTESQAAGAEFAAIDACTTTESWSSANPGAWDDAPAPSCGNSAPLTRNLSGSWSADISELLTVGTVSIVLVPSSHPDTQGAPLPYSLEFSGATIEASAAVEPVATPPPSDPATGGPASEPTTDGPIDVPTTPDDGSVPAGPATSPVATDPIVTIPPFEPDTTDDPGTSRPWSRLVLLVPLAALVGGGTVVAKRIARERGLLSSA